MQSIYESSLQRNQRINILTAPNALEIREKVISTLLEARGKDLRSESQIREFVEKVLPFHMGSSYGGNTPCVRVKTGSDEWLIFDAGSGIQGPSQK